MRRGRLRRGNREGKAGNWKREGQQEGGKGEERRRGKRRGDFTDGYEEMPEWTYGMLGGMMLQSFLTLFTRATPGTPASLY